MLLTPSLQSQRSLHYSSAICSWPS